MAVPFSGASASGLPFSDATARPGAPISPLQKNPATLVPTSSPSTSAAARASTCRCPYSDSPRPLQVKRNAPMASPMLPPTAFSSRYLFSISWRSLFADSTSRTWKRMGMPSCSPGPTTRPPLSVTPLIGRMRQSPSSTSAPLSPGLPSPRSRNFCIFSRVWGSTFEKMSCSASLAGRPPMPSHTGPCTPVTFTLGPTPQQPWQTTVCTATSVRRRPTAPWLHMRAEFPSVAMAIDGMKPAISPGARCTWRAVESPPAFVAPGK
mmetsp:Transcript_90418/g.235391  ORF Transcript_90418/g.235391 Transcript_90418/m.235391 type:complete len:264 (-) Transcript_90418:566-1357(-)